VLFVGSISLAIGGCSGEGLDAASSGKTGDSAGANTIAAGATPTTKVSGQFLARVDITPSHAIEFWEIQPGVVAFIQSLDSAAGEQPIDVESILPVAGGYSGVYRQLMNDEHATLPAELVAADEHFHHLPIRDGFAPASTDVPPQTAQPKTGEPVKQEPKPVAAPGGLTTESAPVPNPNPGTARSIGFTCPGYNTDAGYCPGWQGGTDEGYFYGFVNGSVQETMYWHSIATNPQSGPTSDGSKWNVYRVNQWINGAWANIIQYAVRPGYTVSSGIVGQATYYQGSTTGNIVGYGDGYRLSFPTVTQLASHPLWAGTSFANDINGITHNGDSWILLRTDSGGWGCTATVPFTGDLASEFGRCPNTVPNNTGFNHVGDSVYDPLTGLLYVSLNQSGAKNAAIGVMSGNGSTFHGQTIITPDDQMGWVALDPKTRLFYTSNSAGTVIHRNYVVTSPSITHVAMPDYIFNNPDGNHNIQGGKVSSHGKLWVYASMSDTVHRIMGIDPYSMLIQTKIDLSIDQGPWCTWACSGEEAEGLDITESPTSEQGQIHVQDLGNNFWSNDQWTLSNFAVSDRNRL